MRGLSWRLNVIKLSTPLWSDIPVESTENEAESWTLWLLGNDFMCSTPPVIGLGSTMSHLWGSDMTLMQELSNKRLVRSRAD